LTNPPGATAKSDRYKYVALANTTAAAAGRPLRDQAA
jgi:hypothetical protein